MYVMFLFFSVIVIISVTTKCYKFNNILKNIFSRVENGSSSREGAEGNLGEAASGGTKDTK